MRVERPVLHDRAVEGLWRAAREDRLPHALLFEGEKGTGRFQAAQWFAAGLLCNSGPGVPCLTCAGCKKMAGGEWRSNHADVFVIDAAAEQEEFIRLHRVAYRPDEARVPDPEYSLERFFPFHPLEGVWRVALIREAHRMNPSAQNALLKMLEEPPPATVLVLETHLPSRLFDTIRSRCVRMGFAALGHEDTARILQDHDLAGDNAEQLARWSGGSPGGALALARQGAPQMRALLIGVLVGEVRPPEAAAALWEIDGEFQGNTPLKQTRDRARRCIDLGIEILGDLLRADAGIPSETLAHGDLAELVQDGAWRLREVLEGWLDARHDLDVNLAPDAVMDRCWVDLAPRRKEVAARGR